MGAINRARRETGGSPQPDNSLRGIALKILQILPTKSDSLNQLSTTLTGVKLGLEKFGDADHRTINPDSCHTGSYGDHNREHWSIGTCSRQHIRQAIILNKNHKYYVRFKMCDQIHSNLPPNFTT